MDCTFCKLPGLDLAKLATRLREGANLMIGQPDYDVYAAHSQEKHPETPLMSREEFFLNRQARRFGEGGSRAFRCC